MVRGMTLEERSFINLVNFYGDELRRLDAGEKMESVMPTRQSRKPLYKYGALRKVNPSPCLPSGSKIMLTDEAKKVLGIE